MQTWVTPRADSNGGTTEQSNTDTWMQILRKIPGGSTCKISVLMSVFDSSRDIIVAELKRLRVSGCSVKLITRPDSTTRSKIVAAAIPLRTLSSPYTHQKVLIATGAGIPDVVYAGSHNCDRGSLREADDLLVSYSNPAVLSAFVVDADRKWTLAN